MLPIVAAPKYRGEAEAVGPDEITGSGHKASKAILASHDAVAGKKSSTMLIHSTLSRSAVNGPGERAVVWFQGCDLHCRGCFNPASHPFDRDRDKRVEEVAEWVLACQGIEGVTLSGGEPFQQAGDLRHLCEYIKLRRSDFSIGVFSGYTLQELVRGRWHWKVPGEDAWIKGDPALFMAIKQFLDFGVFGRFRQTMACNGKPLCGSRNQEVVFFTNRYSPSDLEPQGYEVIISGDGGSAIVTGFPPAHSWNQIARDARRSSCTS